jgi:SAM-dependent methyltransferase
MKKLKPEEDAFGQEIWACYKGEEASEIVERDDGLVNSMPAKRYFSDYEAWSPVEQKAMQFVKGRVLDIGCGAGRHSLYLQGKGFDVLGIDVSPIALKVCRERGLKKMKLMSIENVDFKPKSFDTILMMGGNFGLFGNLKKAKKLLKRFHRMTSKDALIIASSRDPYKTDNPAHLQYHKMNKQKGRMSGQVKIRIRYQKYKGRWFDYLMVSKEEMEEILEGTEWKIREFIDSGDSLYIAVIEKT